MWNKKVDWHHILNAEANVLSVHTCRHPWKMEEESQKFCVAVCRQNYPLENVEERGLPRPWIQPAHTITFLPPVVIVNLLPCHLIYRLKREAVEDTIEPGQESFVLVSQFLYIPNFFQLNVFLDRLILRRT